MSFMSAYSDDLAAAASVLDSALIRPLTDSATIGVRVRAPQDADAEPSCLVAAGFTYLAELRLVFQDASCALDLPPAALQAVGARAIAAAAQAAGFSPAEIVLELNEQSVADLGAEGLVFAAKLKARGFCLRLNCTEDAPLGLTQRTRDLFSSAQTPAKAALAASHNLKDVWSDPMARRLVSAKAAGLELLADDAHLEQAEALARLGFSAACFAAAA